MTAWTSADSRLPEPINEAVARWARLASSRLLLALGLVGASGVVLVLAYDWHRWPFASLLAASASFAIWGLLDRLKRRHSGGRFVQTAVAILGAMALAIGLLGILFWALGPAPIL